MFLSLFCILYYNSIIFTELLGDWVINEKTFAWYLEKMEITKEVEKNPCDHTFFNSFNDSLVQNKWSKTIKG